MAGEPSPHLRDQRLERLPLVLGELTPECHREQRLPVGLQDEYPAVVVLDQAPQLGGDGLPDLRNARGSVELGRQGMEHPDLSLWAGLGMGAGRRAATAKHPIWLHVSNHQILDSSAATGS